MDLHKKQGNAFFSDSKVTLCTSGIQGGKTTVGALWFIRQFSKWKGADHNFILTAPTYKILNQSTMPSFLRYANQFGEYKKADQEFKLRSGGTIYIRTGTDPDSIEGITNVRAIWGDEAGKFKYAFWVNMEGRAARTNAPLMLTTTPYALNWVYTDLIRPVERGERNDVAHFSWTSKENPSFPESEYERQRSILDSVTFAMKYGGEHHRRVGLVFPIADGHIIQPMQMPAGTRYYAGLDWGFTNPMALVIRGVTPDGRDIQVSEFYESGVYPDDIAKLLTQKVETYQIKMIVADPADPGKIAMLQRLRLPVIPGDNDFTSGRDAHIQIMRSGKYSIFQTCRHTIDEYETYHYREQDDEDEKDADEEPVKKDNHAMDANRYLSFWLVKNGIHGFDKPKVRNIEQVERPQTSPMIHKAPWEKKRRSEDKPPEYY